MDTKPVRKAERIPQGVKPLFGLWLDPGQHKVDVRRGLADFCERPERPLGVFPGTPGPQGQRVRPVNQPLGGQMATSVDTMGRPVAR